MPHGQRLNQGVSDSERSVRNGYHVECWYTRIRVWHETVRQAHTYVVQHVFAGIDWKFTVETVRAQIINTAHMVVVAMGYEQCTGVVVLCP